MDKFWEGELPSPAERTVGDMLCVLEDAGDAPEKQPLYFMYRSLSKSRKDFQWLFENRLRYDITIIPPRTLGREYVKTKGHYHPDAPCGCGYPELYQVLSGEAHFLLQTKDHYDIVAIEAEEGEVALIPPGYGHVTINPGEDTLIMANIVSDNFESEYSEYILMHGAAYYELSDDGFVKNPNYGKGLPDIRVVKAEEYPGLNLYHKKPIYSLIGKKDSLEFLNNPSILGK
ncbi:glucose-6-phosphate isomerase [Methanomicrobium sp. W14]|uniref:glucose-6-phosphate isomerase family protein n=1 Tax=Methanomicrobium sp. W14 TaxID=2817839 RepID=UPI001AEA3242|nr:glucose-6-phosphate isomerase family protein [Methanomicrobium sp. W14]MBP2134318.1 glucose-6-phosphate isomerase [Methanomicrobium sp. W14]